MQWLKNFIYKEYTTTLTVTSGSGFHLRPVARFVSEAKKFSCDIHIHFNGRSVSAKAVNALLSLNLDKNHTFIISTRGKSAKEALQTLSTLFTTLMKEEKAPIEISKETHHYDGSCIECDIICEGIAVAPLYFYKEKEVQTEDNKNFKEALLAGLNELDSLCHKSQKEDRAIYLAQKALLQALGDETDSLETFTQRIKEESETLRGGKLEAKISDYKDLLRRVKSHMGYHYESTLPDNPFILIADDLLPSDINTLQKSAVQGIILKETSTASHTALLLRTSNIPSLVSPSLPESNTQEVILDAHSGVLVIQASKRDITQALKREEEDKKEALLANKKRFEKAVTNKGVHIKTFANVADTDSAKTAKEEGAEGIGLLRTEFLFTKEKPSFEMQMNAYKEIFALFDTVTVRTLDIGGDKALPYISLPKENNPFLGVRGVRLFQTHRRVLEEQLHAIFKAAHTKPIKVMFPMVSTVEEFTQAKTVAQDVAKKHALDISHIEFGIMIEVPSVLFLLEDFNKVVDFYSIGTNDLTQYLFAIERTHPTLQADPLSSVLFSVIENIVKNADKPVSICGELAANKNAIPKLLDLGIEVLSVSPKSIAKIKETIRDV